MKPLPHLPPLIRRGEALDLIHEYGLGRRQLKRWLDQGLLKPAPLAHRWLHFRTEEIRHLCLPKSTL